MSAVTDEEGRARLQGVRAGAVRVIVQGNRHWDGEQDPVEPRRVELLADERETLTFRVPDESP